MYSQRARRGIDEEEGDGRVVVVTGADGGMAAVTGALAAGGVPTQIADTGTQVLIFFPTACVFSRLSDIKLFLAEDDPRIQKCRWH